MCRSHSQKGLAIIHASLACSSALCCISKLHAACGLDVTCPNEVVLALSKHTQTHQQDVLSSLLGLCVSRRRCGSLRQPHQKARRLSTTTAPAFRWNRGLERASERGETVAVNHLLGWFPKGAASVGCLSRNRRRSARAQVQRESALPRPSRSTLLSSFPPLSHQKADTPLNRLQNEADHPPTCMVVASPPALIQPNVTIANDIQRGPGVLRQSKRIDSHISFAQVWVC